MAKNKEVVPQIDIYREQIIELRAKVLGNLEAQIKNQILDPTEAVQKLASIMLFDKETAIRYVKVMGDASLWRHIA